MLTKVRTVSETWLGFLQVASALCARHIGGAVNYVGVAETLGVSSSAQASGLAADNLLCAVYFAYIFHLARHSPPDTIILEDSGTAELAAVQIEILICANPLSPVPAG